MVLRSCLIILLIFALGTSSLAQPTPDAEFISGLRRLQLFDLAERYCRRELAEQENPPAREVELTTELIRTLAFHALSRPAPKRDELFQQAHDVAAEFGHKNAKHPRLLLVRVQDALTLLAEGEVGIEEMKSTAAAPEASDLAAEKLRVAAKSLDQLAAGIEKEIPTRRRTAPRQDEFTAEELTRLRLQVKLHLAKSHHLQALCYQSGSRDRKALLLATLGDLEKSVAQLEAGDELAGRMRLLQLACYRELGQIDDATRIWSLTQSDELPDETRRAALAEAARLLIANDRPQEALNLFENPKYASLLSQNDSEVDLTRLEAALALARLTTQSNSMEEAAKWQKLAASLAQQIDHEYGRIAGRRADQLVASLLPQDAEGANVDLLARVADNLYVKREVTEAIVAYDKAATAAHASANFKREFELRYKAALAEQQAKHYIAASARFARLSVELQNHPQASEAHLLACWNKAQQLRSDPAAEAAYVELLKDHAARWPDATTADQARIWLGQWHLSHEAWSEAFTAFVAVSRESPEFPSAVARAAQAVRKQLAKERESREDLQQLATEFCSYFTSVAAEKTDKNQPTPGSLAAALVAAELQMEFIPDGHAAAEKLLQESIEGTKEPPTEWLQQATALRIAALAGQSDGREEARQLLQSLAADPGEMLKLLERLAATSKGSSERIRQDLAELQLDVLGRLRQSAGSLTPTQLQEIQVLCAAALANAGRNDEALQVYVKLAQSHPNSGVIQEGYAEQLNKQGDAQSRQRAMDLWRQIATKSPPRTERWYKAKYAIAELQVQLGDRASAATLCRYLLETPPGVKDVEWRERITHLLGEAEK